MFSEELHLTAAQITAITHKMKEGAISGRVTVRAALTHQLAKTLECADLTHLKNGAPRTSFEEISLATGCKAFRALFEIEGLRQSHEMNGDEIGELVVRPTKGGLTVEMRLSYHGDPLELISYWMQVGSGEGDIKISPLQTELEASDDADVEIHVKGPGGLHHVEKVAKSSVRQALGATAKKKKATRGGEFLQ